MENETKKSLPETLAEISSKLEELKDQKKVKEWKLPLMARSISKRKKKEGYVLFQNLDMNKNCTFIKAPIKEHVAMVNGVPHVVNPEDIFLVKGKLPLVIQPQWNERPFNARQNFNEAVEKKQTTMGWEYIMNYLLNTQIKQKKTVSGGLIIIGVLAVIGLGYYLVKSGALS